MICISCCSSFNIIFTRWWCYFSIWISYVSKTLTCIILQSKRQVYLAHISWLHWFWNYLQSVDFKLQHFKKDGKPIFISNMTSGDNLGWLACGTTESANFVSLRFCVLDNNIRNIKCVLSCAGLSAQDLPGRIIRPGARLSAPLRR
jgi:hypothetical protein